MSQWLFFQEVPTTAGRPRKTKRWTVLSAGGAALGTIGWFPRWRQYAFFPLPNTAFNPDCLGDIGAFITTAMAERRSAEAAAER